MDASANNASAVIEAAKQFSEAHVFDVKREPDGSVPLLSVPTGRKIESAKKFFDEYLTAPERRKGTAKLQTVESFIDHANRFKDADSVVFCDSANRQAPNLTAVLDYHRAGDAEKNGQRFGEHRGVYEFPVSEEWQAWAKASAGGPIKQDAFAAFIEDRIGDVIAPETGQDRIKEFAVNLGLTLAGPQRLMELSRGLSIRNDVRVKSASNLSTGEASVIFEESHMDAAGTAPLKVPGGFAIQVPVFRGGPLYQVAVRLRYRLMAPAIVWWVSLHGVDVVWDDAVTQACDLVTEKTELPLLHGRPE